MSGQYWASVGSVSGQCWVSVGSVLGQCWVSVGSVSGEYRVSVGSVSVSVSGQCLVSVGSVPVAVTTQSTGHVQEPASAGCGQKMAPVDLLDSQPLRAVIKGSLSLKTGGAGQIQ